MNFYISEHSSGCVKLGNLICSLVSARDILDCNKFCQYVATINWLGSGWGQNIYMVMDDFGELIKVPARY